jgi:hypothetical protein
VKTSSQRFTRSTGRAKGSPFLMVPMPVLNSEQFGNLSGHATKMLFELSRQLNGRNNGDLSAAWSNLRRRGWRSKRTVHEALHELLTSRFIVLTRQGGKHHVCSLYGVTWLPIQDCGNKHHAAVETVASNLWKTEKQVPMDTHQVPMCTPEPKKAAA